MLEKSTKKPGKWTIWSVVFGTQSSKVLPVTSVKFSEAISLGGCHKRGRKFSKVKNVLIKKWWLKSEHSSSNSHETSSKFQEENSWNDDENRNLANQVRISPTIESIWRIQLGKIILLPEIWGHGKISSNYLHYSIMLNMKIWCEK